MPIIILLALCTLCYAAFEVFAGLAGNRVNSWLAAVLYNGIGTFVPLIIYLSLSHKGKTTVKGIVFAGLAGVAIMLFSLGLARVFARGGELNYVIPVIYGGAIVLSSLYGIFILKEKSGILQSLGLLLVVGGIGCIVLAQTKLKIR